MNHDAEVMILGALVCTDFHAMVRCLDPVVPGAHREPCRWASLGAGAFSLRDKPLRCHT